MDNDSQTQTTAPSGAKSHPVAGAALIAIVLAMGGGFAWDTFGSNAIERARATPGCSQTSQTAELEPHELPNMPSLTDPTAAESHVNIHLRFKATFECLGEPGSISRRVTADVYDDARGLMRADGTIQSDRNIDTKEGLAPFNWPKGG